MAQARRVVSPVTRVTGVGVVLRACKRDHHHHAPTAINATRTEGRVGVAQLAVVVGEGRQLPHDQAHLRFLPQGAEGVGQDPEGVGHTGEQGHKKRCHKAWAGQGAGRAGKGRRGGYERTSGSHSSMIVSMSVTTSPAHRSNPSNASRRK